MLLPIYYRSMINPPQEAGRLYGLNQTSVCSIMNALAQETKSIDLGQGPPSWDPPQFYLKNLEEAQYYSTHQYVKVFGSANYLKAIAGFHQKNFKGHDLENKIIAVNGGSEALYCCIMGLVNEGEEVVIFEPASECYRPQVQMAGGKTIGVQLTPKKRHTKTELIERFEKNGIQATEEDEWSFDWNEFESSFNQKTKMLILTSPHSPVGKIFTHQQITHMAGILKKHPQVVIIEDNVFEAMKYDDMLEKPLPKIINVQGMFDRTLSVYSGGKIFQATGLKFGWVIGPEYLLKYVGAIFQVTCFSQYNVVENALAKSLEYISKPQSQYLINFAKDMTERRNLLVKQLLNSKYDFDMWVPKGGHYIIADISRIQIDQKYVFDSNGSKRTKDFAFAYQLAYESGVICIPCSPFYDKSKITEGERYVRFSFFKGQDLILKAGANIR